MAKPKLSANEKAYFQAAAEGRVEDLRRFTKGGIPVDRLDPELYLLGLVWDTTALMYAAGNGHLEGVRLLLKAGANVSVKSKANKEDGGGESQALHFAAENGNAAVIEELLNAGADVDAQGNWGRTPLVIAAGTGNVEAVRLLLKRGAKADPKTRRKLDLPPLCAAITAEEVPAPLKKELVEILIQAGAAPNLVGDGSQTALHLLSSARDMPDEIRASLFEVLLKAGATVDQIDRFGGTALQGAVNSKAPKSVKILLEHGADTKRVFGGGTVLQIAKDNVRISKEQLADKSLADKWREAVKAELRDAEAVVQILKEHGVKK